MAEYVYGVVEREARALNVSGWVRNTEDSTVELVAVGTEEQQIQLRERLRPPSVQRTS